MTTAPPEAPAAAPDAGDFDPDLTEIIKLAADRVDGVFAPANGINFLLMKAVGGAAKDVHPEGGIDEGPDIDLAEQILALIGQAIESEARELSAGEHDETDDIELLAQAACLVRCWKNRESGNAANMMMDAYTSLGKMLGAPGHADAEPVIKDESELSDAAITALGDAEDEALAVALEAELGKAAHDIDDVVKIGRRFAKAKRKFSAAERRRHAKAGNALADGSYPIPDKDALRRASILARSKHGNWQAARRLIARRARELGASNPLAKKPKKGPATKPARKDTMDGNADPKYATADEVREIVAEQVAESLKPVAAFMEKAAAQPVPRGPMTAVAPRTTPADGGATRDELLAKAAEYRKTASECGDGAMAADYRQLATEAEDRAAKLQ
jgi:hypothetical protein